MTILNGPLLAGPLTISKSAYTSEASPHFISVSVTYHYHFKPMKIEATNNKALKGLLDRGV